MSSDIDGFLRKAKDPLFVGLLLWLFLLALGFLFPIVWGFVFPMLFGFLIFDVVLNGFVRGRKIPLSENGHEFKPKGWVFGAYLIGILMASILSALLSQWVVDSLNDPNFPLLIRAFGIIFADSLVTLLLWADFVTKVWNAK